ncbi:MAG: hypothetical protein KGJ95_10315 [Candidatus Omnitrophica bacterium]|nr:hypothetical protein [Candidatus Omnitrophota bacterium]
MSSEAPARESPSGLIYLERLTLAWLQADLPKLVQLKPAEKIQVFFFDHDPAALALAQVLSGICPVTFQELRFQCAEVRDKDGVSVRLKVVYEELAVMGGMICRDIPDSLKKDKRLALFLMKAPVCSLDLYSEGRYLLIRQAVQLINFVRWHAGTINGAPKVTELFLFSRPFSQQLCEYAASKHIRLSLMKPYHSWKAPWQKIGKKFSKLNVKVFKALLRHILSTVFGPKVRTQESSQFADTRLLLESRLEFGLNPQRISDLFFLDAEGIRGNDVRLVFNGSYNPVDEDKLRVMQQEGIEAIALTAQSSLVSPSKVPVFHRGSAGTRMDERWDFSRLPKDYAAFTAQYAHCRSYWEDFFKRCQIKLWASFYKNEPEHIAMAEALSMAGGVSAIYQRSYESNPTPILAVGSDIIFSFSKAEYGIEMQNGSDFRYHVATGYLGDFRFGHLREGAKQLRQSLAQAGARHVLAFFDENTIDDGRWFFNHRFLQENYEFWLEKLLTTPTLGLIFKPKVPKTLRARLGAAAGLLDKARQTGRCYVFDQGDIQSPFPPAAASMASDLAVHEMLGTATAGLESALSGTRTILMDFEGWPSSPLYQLGEDVIFKDWDSAWRACQDYFKDPSPASPLGDWSAMIDRLDPFHDGLAARRMSGYLKELLEGLRRNERPSDVMARAAESYARRWGKDKVQRGPRQ